MKKDEYAELMHQVVFGIGDIDPKEKKKLDHHIKNNPAAKKQFAELKRLKKVISANPPAPLPDRDLIDARRSLRETLRSEPQHTLFAKNIRSWFAPLFQPAGAVAGLALLAIGMLIGFLISSATPEHVLKEEAAMLGGQSVPSKPLIANIRFIDSDASDGEVEFEFDAVAPMHVKGKIDNPEIQKLLTHALLNASNAGVRLSSVNAIRNQTNQAAMVDPSIKSALITSMKSDINPGVRREALKVLQQFEFDNDIKDALLFVIAQDGNSGMRVAAINALEIAKMNGRIFDAATIEALKQQITGEQNSYIRNRAAHLVKEIYQ